LDGVVAGDVTNRLNRLPLGRGLFV
jgi:hypothetical protein